MHLAKLQLNKLKLFISIRRKITYNFFGKRWGLSGQILSRVFKNGI
jgi:hypothetical protein